MNQQPSFFDPPSPPSGPLPPVSGKTRLARRASESGARIVVRTWTERQSVVLQLLAGGPKTRQELAALQTKYPLCSICSVVGALLKRGAIEEDKSVDLVDMGNGEQSMRTRLRIKGR